MSGNVVKKVMLKIVADDGDTEAKLDKISAKADELGRKHPELQVRINTAAAGAKLAVLRKELKDTGKEADQGHHFSLSGLMPAVGEMSMAQKAMMGLNVATTFAEPLLAGVVVAAGGLASGFAAAGAGLGIFGKVAEGVQKQVSSAVGAYATAMSTTGAAQKRAMSQYHQFMGALTGTQRQLVHSENAASGAWQSFVNKNTAGVAAIMTQGMGLLPKIFSAMQPFLAPVEHALHGIIGELGKGLDSSGFKSFMATLAANTGPAITKLSAAIGHIVVGIGGILKAFMPASQGILTGLDHITAKFARWGTTLSGHSGFQSLMATFRTETPLAVKTLKNLGSAIATIVKDMTGLSGPGNSKMLLQLAEPFTALLKVLLKANPALVRVGLYLLAAGSGLGKLSKAFGGVKDGFSAISSGAGAVKNLSAGFGDAEKAASDATGAWGTFGGKLSSVMSSAGSMITGLGQKMGILKASTEGETVAQEGLDGAMDANPIGLIVIAIGALALGIYELVKHSAAFRSFWKGLWKDITHLVSDAVSFIKDHWKLLPAIFLGPVGVVVSLVLTHWNQIRSMTVRLVGDVVGFFEKLPGRIVSVLGNMGALLLNAGKSLMEGLLHGIEAGWDDVKGFVGKVGGWISDLKGPLPKDRVLLIPHGQAIMGGLLTGLNSRMPDLAGQMARTMAAIQGGIGGVHGYGAAGGGHRQEIVLEFHGSGSALDGVFWTWLQHGIRVRGGNPDIVNRKVKFA